MQQIIDEMSLTGLDEKGKARWAKPNQRVDLLILRKNSCHEWKGSCQWDTDSLTMNGNERRTEGRDLVFVQVHGTPRRA